MSKANEAEQAAESVSEFIDREGEALELPEYVEFLECLLSDVKTRLDAAREDLYGA